MRIITTLALCLWTSAALASFIIDYKGEYFPVENLQQCKSEFTKISQRLESYPGFKIISGGCVRYTDKMVQISFNYAYPLKGFIQQLTRKYDTKEECAVATTTAAEVFSKAKMGYVASYCKGYELYADYVYLVENTIRGVYAQLSFPTKTACYDYLNDLEFSLSKFEIHSLFKTCNKDYSSEVTLYNPSIELSLNFHQHVQFIIGKSLAVGRGCLEDRSTIRDNFRNAGIPVAHALCAAPRFGGEKQEVIFYVLDDKVTPLVKHLEAGATQELSECEASLEQATGNLRALGHKELYKFCRNTNSGLFRPIIYFSQERFNRED